MKTLFLTSGNPRDEIDSLNALKYVADRLAISACALDGDAALERFAHFCAERSIALYTRSTVYTAISENRLQAPDIGLSYHYHSIVRKELLHFPKNGIINFHPAPLPEHKGVSACTYAILHDYSQWGVSAHYMEERPDTGALVKVRTFDIGKFDCASIVLQRINYRHLYELFKEVVDELASGIIPAGAPQEAGGHYYSRKQLNQDKIVNLTDDRRTIDHKIKAMWFPPFHGANITLDGEKYTLINQKILDELGVLYSLALEEHKELFGDLE